MTDNGSPEFWRAVASWMAGSCPRRLGDAVDPAAILFGRGKGEPELLLQGSREDPAHRVPLPAGRARHLIDRCTFAAAQHGNDRILLRWTFVVRLRLRQ